MLKYDILYPKYKHMIIRIATPYLNSYNHDDIMQSAHLGFIQAIKTYDKSRSQFVTWAYIHIRKACQLQRNMEYITTCSSETRKKMKPENRIPIEKCNLESNKCDDVIKLIDEFFDYRSNNKYRKLFLDAYVFEKNKMYLEKRYGMNRKKLNNTLKILNEEFRRWYKEDNNA